MMRRLIINGWIILPINTQHSAIHCVKKLSKKFKKSLQCQGKEWNFCWFIVEWFLKSINLCKISLDSIALEEWRLMWNDIFEADSSGDGWQEAKWEEKKIDGWSLWKMKYKWKLRNNHFTKWCMAQFWRELSEHFYIICNESPTFWLKPGIHKLFSLTSLESSAFLSNFFAILLSSTWLHIVDCARHHKRVKLWRKVVLMIYLRLSLPFEPVAVECFLMKCKSRKCVDRSLSHYLFTRKALIFFGWFANLWIFDNVQGSENAFNGVKIFLQRKLQQYNKLKCFFCGCFFFSARLNCIKRV